MEDEELFNEEDKDIIIKTLKEHNRILSYELYELKNENARKQDLFNHIENILYVLERIEKKLYEKK